MILVISAQFKQIPSDFLPFFSTLGAQLPQGIQMRTLNCFYYRSDGPGCPYPDVPPGKTLRRLAQTRRTVIFTAADTLSILNRIVEDRLRVSSPLTC